MIRTQIQLTEPQAAALRAMSAARQVSMAELIRISIDAFVQRESGSSRAALLARAKSVAGEFDSGLSDVSTNHDHHLAEAITGK
jgi:DNA-binding XRE family transcriptional regulator